MNDESTFEDREARLLAVALKNAAFQKPVPAGLDRRVLKRVRDVSARRHAVPRWLKVAASIALVASFAAFAAVVTVQTTNEPTSEPANQTAVDAEAQDANENAASGATPSATSATSISSNSKGVTSMKITRKRAAVAAFSAALAATPALATSPGRLTARSYILDGLVAHWDGEFNVGYDAAHDGSATTWTDLTGNGQDITVPNNASFSAKGLDTVRRYGKNVENWERIKEAFTNSVYTVEIAFNKTNEVATSSSALGTKLCKMLMFGNEGYYVGLDEDDKAGFQPTWERYEGGLARYVKLSSNLGQHTLTCVQNKTAVVIKADDKSKTINNSLATIASLANGFRFNRSYYVDVGLDGTYYDIRIYGRCLSDDEIAVNRAVDQVRFFGADASQISLPTGWAFDVDGDSVRLLKARVATASTGGSVSVDGGESGASVDFWCEVGCSTNIALVATPDAGYEFVRWTGCVTEDAKSTDAATTMAVTGDVRAEFRRIGTYRLNAESYVTNGLVAQWDGEFNVAAGAPHSASAATWQSLVGESSIALPVGAAFCANGLTVARANGSTVTKSGVIKRAFTNSNYTVEIAYNKTIETAKSSQGEKNDICMMLAMGNNNFPVGTRQNKIGFNPSGSNGGAGSGNNIVVKVDVDTTVGHHTFSCSHGGGAVSVCADNSVSFAGNLAPQANPDQPATHSYWFNRGYYEDYGMDGVYHAIRFYNRVLTADEVSVNQAVDQVRFFGFDPAEIELPEGWRFDVSDGIRLDRRCTAAASDPQRGMVSVNGGPAAGSVPMWAGCGASAPVVLEALPKDGFAFSRWEGAISSGDVEASAGQFAVCGDVRAVFVRVGTTIIIW